MLKATKLTNWEFHDNCGQSGPRHARAEHKTWCPFSPKINHQSVLSHKGHHFLSYLGAYMRQATLPRGQKTHGKKAGGHLSINSMEGKHSQHIESEQKLSQFYRVRNFLMAHVEKMSPKATKLGVKSPGGILRRLKWLFSWCFDGTWNACVI